jgi:transposase
MLGVLKKVLPPDARSIVDVSRETGINNQTIRNWLKKSKSGILPDSLQESSPRFMTPKEKYQLVLEAAGVDNEQLGGFLRERGLHSEHITIWDQELRKMIDKKKIKRIRSLKLERKETMCLRRSFSEWRKLLLRASTTSSVRKSSMLL